MKDLSKMFIEPVHIGQCPLCKGNVYSENNPSNDPNMSRRCCKCTWNDNQFMTWEEMNSFNKPVSNGVVLEQRL